MPAALRHPLRRRGSRASAIACAAAATLLAGCGVGDRTPSLERLPLVSGVHVLVSEQACDKGANAFCALEMVLRDPGYPNSRSLALAERALLKRKGWSKVNAPVGLELAADSPGDRLRVTYSGASAELQAIDLGWIKRSRRITLTLSREIFNHSPAMAVLLQLGTTP